MSDTSYDINISEYTGVGYVDGGDPPINAQNLNRSEEALEKLLGKTNADGTHTAGQLPTELNKLYNFIDTTNKNLSKEHDVDIGIINTSLSTEAETRAADDETIKKRFNAYIGITETYNNNPTTTNYLPKNTSVSQHIYNIDNLLKKLLGVDLSKTYNPKTEDGNYLPTDKSVAQYVAEIKQELQDNIDTEKARAEEEEEKLQGNINTEAKNRSDKDAEILKFIGDISSDTVKDYVDTEVSTAKEIIMESLTLNVIIDGGTSNTLLTD